MSCLTKILLCSSLTFNCARLMAIESLSIDNDLEVVRSYGVKNCLYKNRNICLGVGGVCVIVFAWWLISARKNNQVVMDRKPADQEQNAQNIITCKGILLKNGQKIVATKKSVTFGQSDVRLFRSEDPPSACR